MKYILLGDTHFDERNGESKLLAMQMKFMTDQLFPYMVENGITTIIQLGDITNNRTHLTLNTQHEMLKMFSKMEELELDMIYLVGNHDIFHKDDREIYSMEVFEHAFPDTLSIINKPELIQHGMYLVPWLCSSETLTIPGGTKGVFGHFEMKDFYVTRSFKSEHGLDKSFFKSLPVYSGHYHIKQDTGNIHYVGTPYQLDWNDFNTLKGFHVIETETMETEFIENTTTPKHIKITLDVETKQIWMEGYTSGAITTGVDDFIKGGLNGTHKIKVYAKKELAITKKLVESLEASGHVVKLEITPENEEVNVEERIEKVKSMSISENILAIVDDDDKNITHDIVIAAKSLMLQERGE